MLQLMHVLVHGVNVTVYRPTHCCEYTFKDLLGMCVCVWSINDKILIHERLIHTVATNHAI